MDAIADDLDIQVGQNDLTERLMLMSQQYGIEPQQLIQLLQQNNQLPAMFADVRRGLTRGRGGRGGHRHRHRRQRHRHHRVLRFADAEGDDEAAELIEAIEADVADAEKRREPQTPKPRLMPMTRPRRPQNSVYAR